MKMVFWLTMCYPLKNLIAQKSLNGLKENNIVLSYKFLANINYLNTVVEFACIVGIIITSLMLT